MDYQRVLEKDCLGLFIEKIITDYKNNKKNYIVDIKIINELYISYSIFYLTICHKDKKMFTLEEKEKLNIFFNKIKIIYNDTENKINVIPNFAENNEINLIFIIATENTNINFHNSTVQVFIDIICRLLCNYIWYKDKIKEIPMKDIIDLTNFLLKKDLISYKTAYKLVAITHKIKSKLYNNVILKSLKFKSKQKIEEEGVNIYFDFENDILASLFKKIIKGEITLEEIRHKIDSNLYDGLKEKLDDFYNNNFEYALSINIERKECERLYNEYIEEKKKQEQHPEM